jgi:predicted Zn-dependent peptidase
MLNYLKTVLPSGLTVIRVPMPAVKSVTVLALVSTGSRYEPEKWFGISHFLEHMVFKGTQKYPDSQALAAAVDAVGAKFNAFTSKEYTGYYVKAASQHSGLALDFVSDQLLTPQLKQEDIDREKGVIIEEINMYADMPSAHIGNLFEQMVYQPSGLGHDVLGTKETVSSLTTQDFQSYLKQWYGLKNVVLILAGDDTVLSKESVLSEIETAFSKGNSKERQAEKFSDHLEKRPLSEERLLVEFKQTEQAHFIMGFPGISRSHKARHALSLLSVILGGNMSSRLFTEVREKRGLCYYVHSDTDFFHDCGLFGASAGVDPKRVEEAIKVTREEFLTVTTGQKPITALDLKTAKDYLIGKVIMDLEDSESVAQYFGMKQLLTGRVETPEELFAKFNAVTLEEIQGIADKLIQPDQLRLALIGPFKQAKNFEKFLN